MAGEDKIKAGFKKRDGPNLAVEVSQIMEESRRKPFGRQAMIENPLLVKSPHREQFTALNSRKQQKTLEDLLLLFVSLGKKQPLTSLHSIYVLFKSGASESVKGNRVHLNFQSLEYFGDYC